MVSHERKREPVTYCIYRFKLRKINILSFVITIVMCIIVGCGNKSGKSSQKMESVVKFSRVPKIVLTEGEVLEELTTRR